MVEAPACAHLVEAETPLVLHVFLHPAARASLAARHSAHGPLPKCGLGYDRASQGGAVAAGAQQREQQRTSSVQTTSVATTECTRPAQQHSLHHYLQTQYERDRSPFARISVRKVAAPTAPCTAAAGWSAPAPRRASRLLVSP